MKTGDLIWTGSILNRSCSPRRHMMAGSASSYLRFRSGEVYRYFEFPEEQYRELLDAESRGRYFLSNIRNRFRYERLAKLHAA